jgi:hypothetical protein
VRDWLLPRWGIGSVRLHIEPNELAIAVLLFDRIVMPTPENFDEVDRWASRGWKPDKLASRIVQLGDLVHMVPWDERLRTDWRARFEKAKELAAETQGLAYGLTPMTIAMTAWEDVYGHAAREGRAPVRPVPVAWYPGSKEAPEELGVRDVGQPAPALEELEREVAVLFRRELDAPLTQDPEESLDIAVRLADDDDFAQARRSLFEWEALMAAQDVPPGQAVEKLSKEAKKYDDIVREHAGGLTVRHAVHAVVPTGIKNAGKLAPIPGVGYALGWAARYVLARAMPLPPAPDPEAPEAALSMARRSMSALMT